MSKVEYYMNLPYDLSGSMSKNRFRNELLWGLKKMYELYKTKEDFVVVFDYRCDIEVHLENKFEFYQVKTQNNSGTYTINKLTDKKKGTKSVVGNLYSLKYDINMNENDDVYVAIVSNAPLNDGKKTYNNSHEVKIKTIDSSAIEKIKLSIKNDLNIDKDINLENLFFIRIGLDLIEPQKTLIGETAIFFEDVFGRECSKVKSLYNVLYEEIYSKSAYELDINTYENIVSKKGITRDRMDIILKSYANNTDKSVELAKCSINEWYKNNFSRRLSLIKSLTTIVFKLSESSTLKDIENYILSYIYNNIDKLQVSDKEIIEIISEIVEEKRPIEVSKTDIEALILLTLKRYEEGVYE
ncbi:DUF4297 domain-containing protein [Clostridioides difficile]|uniref:dsDNA nuclease domain-containing protein n=1 Tax=Clostridioides difficile TaxID=1496 RepID=UPI001C15F728|nr:DUF4297 domain-containing protein [Clostridioides difficile]MBY1883491.1 DUF4297 domain-containing protein [Clostridioides difficile]MBZ0781390.1 DUF4297 domain-containing protein [Clostridioides difficile]MBZ0855034.1 DUF4297 domain-containing protein [Clostridioides difficile]MCG7701616.1 DUF4297 domain-containing protein [Clostridioides difficile]